MNTSVREDRGTRERTVALGDKKRQPVSTGAADLDRKLRVIRLTGHFPALCFPRPEFDFKGRKFLLICSPMQKKMTRKGWRGKGDYHTSSSFFIAVKLL